jgi:uncharacterized protein YkwD
MYRTKSLAENVAVGAASIDGDGIVDAWLRSETHAFNLGWDGWSFTGLGIVVGDGGLVYATQLFGVREVGQMGAEDRLRGF